MKRKLANRAHWDRILERRFCIAHIESEEFTGSITLLQLDKVQEPLWVECEGTNVCIVDSGFAWLQQFPTGAHYTITTAFDADGKIVQWYIDICKQQGVTEEGMPWYDDLYLDIAYLPSGELMILDADELDEALLEGQITQADHDLAWSETERLLEEIKQGTLNIFNLCEAHRAYLLQ